MRIFKLFFVNNFIPNFIHTNFYMTQFLTGHDPSTIHRVHVITHPYKIQVIFPGLNWTGLSSSLLHQKRTESSSHHELTIICCQQNDALIASNIPGKVNQVIEMIRRNFEINIDNSKTYIGIEYDYDRKSGKIKSSQSKYLQEKLKLFGMQECKPTSTPIARGSDTFSESLRIGYLN
ncbi:hypothetical protein SSS_04799 [Sarcoptes scabiei]|uniref:Reverse transcriptase Ty1/copia-type domain-containing protein n=1 Tax=Sarcoptes scabiei TaxID=52283 RepID=A0A834VGT1_SARSC|nr:hypothetical protein SSS_04799 [Sarcoptes scabiei]